MVEIYSDLPKDEAHGWKFIGIGPDNKLYVPVGLPCNSCPAPDTHAQIRRINLDGTGAEVVARGVRNTVGFDWHPVSKELYFTDNSRDWVSEDFPEDELNRVTKTGQHFGNPFCHQGDFLDPELGWGRSCDEFEKPVAKMGPHTAVLGARFYAGGNFPAKYKNALFVARHGSWNRSKKAGGDIVAVFLNKDGTVKSMEPFITGFLENNSYHGRPVDVLFLKDGSMLISDDFNGAVWRVTYGNPKSARRRSNACPARDAARLAVLADARPGRFLRSRVAQRLAPHAPGTRASCDRSPLSCIGALATGAQAATYDEKLADLPRLPRREGHFRNAAKCPRSPACRRTPR